MIWPYIMPSFTARGCKRQRPVTIILAVIVALNFSPVESFAESEFWFAGTKAIMLVGLLLMGIILMLGGGPSGDRIGFRIWNDPGALIEHILGDASGRFKAFLYVRVFSGFSFYFGPSSSSSPTVRCTTHVRTSQLLAVASSIALHSSTCSASWLLVHSAARTHRTSHLELEMRTRVCWSLPYAMPAFRCSLPSSTARY